MSSPRALGLQESNGDDGAPPLEAAALRDYWRVLIQRKLIVIACVVGALVLCASFLLVSTPEFEATTTIQIDRHGPDILTYRDVVGVDPSYAAYQDFYQTQYKILQSRAVLRLTAERLDLLNRPQFTERPRSALSRMLSSLRGGGDASEEASDPWLPALQVLAEALSVRPLRNSQLVVVTFTHHDPAFAAEVANAVAASYLQFNFDARYGTTAIAREFLTKEVARVQTEIDQLEKELQATYRRKEIFSVSDGVQDISQQALADLNQRYIQARSDLALAEARHRAMRGAGSADLPEVLTSPLIATLKDRHAEVERRYTQQLERFKDDWPALTQLRQELDQAKQRLDQETETLAEQVRRVAERAHLRAQAEVEALARQVDTQKVEFQRVSGDAVEVSSLRAAIETKRQVLSGLVARESETQTSERLSDTRASNIRIVDTADVPTRPVRPRKVFTLVVGLILGSALGIGCAFLLDHLDNTIKHEEDLRRFSGLPVLGAVPFHAPSVANDASTAGAGPNLDLESHRSPRSAFAEATKNIRTSILLASADEPPRHLVVSSCEPNDGKSTVALNLGIVLTQSGRRILLIDADLRRPRLHHAMGVDNVEGLSSLLTGNATVDQLIRSTVVPGLDLITSGPIPPNPSELLDSNGLKALLTSADLARRYDHVIFDSPPALSVSDAIILAARTDGMILVVRAGETSRDSLSHAAGRLRQARVRVIGTILNAVTHSGERYNYYYYGNDLAAARDREAASTSPRVGRVFRVAQRRRGGGRSA